MFRQTRSGRKLPNETTEEILDVMDDLLEAGERDACEGGIPTEAIAPHVDVSQGTVTDHMTMLVERGEVVRVYGMDTERHRERPSYLPADHPEVEP